MTYLSFLAKVWQFILVIDEEGSYDRMHNENEIKEQAVALVRDAQVPRHLVVLTLDACAPVWARTRSRIHMVIHGLAPSSVRCTDCSAAPVSACIASWNLSETCH